VEQFCVGHAVANDWQDVVAESLASLGSVAGSANLGFVYVTDPHAANFENILQRLKSATGVEHWVGTVGLAVCATGVEYYEKPAMALMLASFDTDSFRVFSSIKQNLDGFETQNGTWCTDHQPYFGVVHADPRNPNVPELAVRLSERMQGGFLVGGLASARQTFSHVANVVEEGGLSGVLFDTSVSVTTRLSQGCSLLGRRHQITRGDQNLIVELDGRAALDVLKEEVGEVIARDLSKAAGYIFVALPVRGADTGDYLVRNLVGIDPAQGGIAIGDNVSTGDTVMFCRRDGASAIEDMSRMLGELKKSLKRPARGAIYTSCLGRGANLFGHNSEELKMIETALGPIPLVGFYANGEISNDRLYTYTGVLTLFA
jgi:small ligand-binding sensory domain FIST